ncbi:hypothetical protein UlMin_036691 [Ulmus minor]
MVDNSNALSNPSISAMLTLNGTNYKQWRESLLMNLNIMKLDLQKKYRDEWEHSNRCCLMIMRYHMEESIRDSIEGFKKFSKKHLNMLQKLSYDGTSGNRSHIDKVISCYRKLLSIGVKLLDDDYMVWLLIRTLPPQFDAIRSSYNAQKEQWSLEEMTTILAKKEDDIKNGQGCSVSKKKFHCKHFSKQFKKKPASGKPNAHTGVQSSGTKKDSFPGKCNFYHNFGHKKAKCRKFKAWLEKKGLDKQKESWSSMCLWANGLV